jgi:hypothetical protein
MNYVECDMPDGMTLVQWRRLKGLDRSRARRRRWPLRRTPSVRRDARARAGHRA